MDFQGITSQNVVLFIANAAGTSNSTQSGFYIDQKSKFSSILRLVQPYR
jgi:accessory colonization factor AcfC